MALSSRVLHRDLRTLPRRAASAQGCWITDVDGRRYLDASGGAAVSCLGHGHPDVLAALHRQIDAIAYAHTGFFTTAVAEELADTLVAGAPAGIGHAFFVSSGSEAVEAALKMARQSFVDRGEPGRTHFIARRQSYHGNTLGALAVGGNFARRATFAPLLVDVTHVSPCYPYREQRDGESAEAYGARLAEELDAAIRAIGPERVIGFVAETIGGATAGVLVPVPGYLAAVREVCDRHGVLLILDEVMCGLGRIGSLHACSQEGVVPDLLVLAKGLGGGVQPIGALLAQGRIVEMLARSSGAFLHSHTYVGHPATCAAALAVQQVIARDGLVARSARMGERLMADLREALGDHPHVGDIRGRGLFIGIELVRDRASKAPFDPDLRLHARVKRAAFERGLLVYPMGGTIDGRLGDHVVVAPPFILSEAESGQITERLTDALAAALTGIR